MDSRGAWRGGDRRALERGRDIAAGSARPEGHRPKLLVLSLDAVGEEMAGAAIRAYELARALSAHADVTIAATEYDGHPLDVPCVTFNRHSGRTLRPHLEGVDVVFGQPQWPLVLRELRRSGARLIFDLYAPDIVETLEYLDPGRPRVRGLISAMTVDRISDALRAGHHFVCATESQRDYWLGLLTGERLMRPEAYDRDPTFESVISIVPFGVGEVPPAGGGGIRRRFAEVGGDDEIVLWNGGLWNWLDADTAIRAVAAVAERRPGLRLVFMGTSDRPAGRRALDAACSLAAELGVLDQVVLFGKGWVGYRERADWLLDADCSVSCHTYNLETHFAYRTRILDCIWAGLPVVCTEGDALAEEVAAYELGEVVPESDPEALARALEQVLDRGRSAYAEPLREAAERHRWSRVADPLIEQLEVAPKPAPLGWRGRRLGHKLRAGTYCAARLPLNAAGVSGWLAKSPTDIGAG